ncbi:hypothetical protein RHMOL_Rhmol04G0200300 [Rhododendron molle]|uniref:Uncharacterized protein n=1 Tax=Rhododendron molle TaxID=49168 RepID=A0ACC0P3P5_RHOML|nr:hypothetical protein RHMOL_Rhmol04G0200300 [Rhododendron molle]
MFPEIVECPIGVEILEGAQRDVNVGDTRYRVVSASSSLGSVQSSGGKKLRGQVTLFRASRALSYLLKSGLQEFSSNVKLCVPVVVSLVIFVLIVCGVKDLAFLMGSLTISGETVHRILASRKPLIHKGNRPLE